MCVRLTGQMKYKKLFFRSSPIYDIIIKIIGRFAIIYSVSVLRLVIVDGGGIGLKTKFTLQTYNG
ncbi:hypothetical protein BLOT_000776 [Blomia tropicalis]|nr:hypothetical protein BLOT_000776 [Blomia tropicalis]